MFGKNACVVVLFNDNQMSKSCDCETCNLVIFMKEIRFLKLFFS